MRNKTLALFGGDPIISQPLRIYNSIGEEELAAATAVIRSGVLSGYIGAPGEAFMGGPRVRAFEKQTADYFGVDFAIAVNSWTSGLIAAVGAIGLEPGDEVITTPWTMCATATAILHWNGIPVFADIDSETYNINPASVERAIGPRTRAIMAVDIFGQSADVISLKEIARRHDLKVISDTAQAPGARVGNSYAGTIADIGGFSLNYHKHVHCGEGGVIVTNDEKYASRLYLIRNHAEAVIQSHEPAELCNMLGYNFRLGEIEAAISSEQLKKLESQIQSRQRVASQLNEGLRDLDGLCLPVVAKGNTHAYYLYAMTLKTEQLAISRDEIIEALRAEGVPGLFGGYQNLHLLPLFRHKIAYGTLGFPWTSPYAGRDVSYGPGLCPIAEDLHRNSLFGINTCSHEFAEDDVALIVEAFHKVWNQLSALRKCA
jgi:perosamine synthetase